MVKRKIPVTELIQQFRDRQPPEVTGALFERLQDLVDFDRPGAQPPNPVVEVDHLIELASAQRDRGDGGLFLDQKAARRAYFLLFQQLEAAEWGRVIVGRRGHSTRFVFKAHPERGFRGLLVMLKELGVELDYDGEGARPKASTRSTSEPFIRDVVLAKLKAHWPEIQSFGVRALDVFGSVARGDARPDSDVDLLVDFERPLTSDAFFGTKFFLEDLLERRIDLVTRETLREPIRRAVERELVRVA